MIKAVIFDWSGVLSDDFENVFNAENEILKMHGKPQLSKEEFREEYDAPYMENYKKWGINKSQAEILQIWAEIFPKIRKEQNPMPRAKETLTWLKENGKKVVILSSHRQEWLEGEIVDYDLEGLIDSVHASVHDKRDEINALLLKNKIRPEEAIFVGDMGHDIQTAKHAGVLSCAILTGYHPKHRLEKENPDYIVKDLRELKDLIKKLNGESK